jgi:hypothetical protein
VPPIFSSLVIFSEWQSYDAFRLRSFYTRLYYFLSLRSRYSPQHFVCKRSKSVLFAYRVKQIFTSRERKQAKLQFSFCKFAYICIPCENILNSSLFLCVIFVFFLCKLLLLLELRLSVEHWYSWNLARWGINSLNRILITSILNVRNIFCDCT